MRLTYQAAAVVAGVITGFLPAAANPAAAALVSPGRAAAHAATASVTTRQAAARPDARSGVGLRSGMAQLGGAADSTPIAVSPDGSKVFVGGPPLVAYNPATGARLWRAGAAVFSGGCCAVVISPDGSTLFAAGAAIVGSPEEEGSTREYATAAFDAVTGAQLWVATYHGPGVGSDVTRSLAVSPDGSKVFVTGQSSNTTNPSLFNNAYATVAYDAATGAQLWVARYSGANMGSVANSVAVSPHGSLVFVTGASAGPTGRAMFATVAYSAARGAVVWVARYAVGSRNAAAVSVAVSPDGSKVYVGGTAHAKWGQQVFATVAYRAASGAKLWATLYPRRPSPVVGSSGITSMTVSPHGSKVFVTGQSKSKRTGIYEYATVAYDAATGAQLWVKRSRMGLLGLPFSMAVSPHGSKVFVTGYAEITGTTTDYATVAYNAATGAKLWARLYSGQVEGLSQAHGVAVTPRGSKAFVTGVSPALTGRNHATVAYNAATGAVLWVARD